MGAFSGHEKEHGKKKGMAMKKMIKLFGISAILMGMVIFASGCDKFSCDTGSCAVPVIEDCSPCAEVVVCDPCN